MQKKLQKILLSLEVPDLQAVADYASFRLWWVRSRSPLFLASIHLLATLCTLALFPPLPHTPPLAVPLAWSASLSITIVSWKLLS
jgi:hypothetical protein